MNKINFIGKAVTDLICTNNVNPFIRDRTISKKTGWEVRISLLIRLNNNTVTFK